MTSLVVRKDAILMLKSGEYLGLLQDGHCSWSYYPPDTDFSHRKRDVPLPADNCLAVNYSRGPYYFEAEPEADLNLLLDHSCIAYCDAAANTVLRGSYTSLRAAVMDRIGTGILGDPKEFLPTIDGCDAYGNFFRDEAVQAVESYGTFFGQLSVCACGESGCGATYAWLENGRCLLAVEIVAVGICTVEIGPFPIIRPVATDGK